MTPASPLKKKFQGTSGLYYILVINFKIACVDESRSDFLKFEEGDEVRPDLVGYYRAMNILKVDKSKINKNIFRVDKSVQYSSK